MAFVCACVAFIHGLKALRVNMCAEIRGMVCDSHFENVSLECDVSRLLIRIGGCEENELVGGTSAGYNSLLKIQMESRG